MAHWLFCANNRSLLGSSERIAGDHPQAIDRALLQFNRHNLRSVGDPFDRIN
jgi:hypothetical protein